MDSRQLIEELLTTGKKLAEKGKAIAEKKLNIPEDPEQREVALDGLKKGAAVAGVLAILFGTRAGRALTGTAVRLGGVAALGTVAYKAYTNWKGGEVDGKSVVDLNGEDAQTRSFLILKAMVAASNSDGHINSSEKNELKSQIAKMHLPEHLLDEVRSVIDNPPTWQDVVKETNSAAEASEVYLATRLFIHKHSSQVEQEYLKNLVNGLGLDDGLVVELDKQLED